MIDIVGWSFLAIASMAIVYIFVKLLIFAMDALIKNDD
jgi:uncharacterized membrane protein YjfL (UPF0719 family)